MLIRSVPKLVASIALCQGAGILGSLFTTPAIPTWYKTLIKPEFGPPNWLFGPVWLTLFTLMGISFYLIWQKGTKKREVRQALGLFFIHLVFNVLWSFLFFGLKNPFYGLIDILVLWLLIVLTAYKFWQIDKRAGWLLLPYLAWVSFASFLNYKIWLLN